MLNEAEERVARAVVEAINQSGGIFMSAMDWDAIPQPFIEGILKAISRAAIRAMREPSPRMVEAMEDSHFEEWSAEPGEGRDSLNLDVAWRAAIDAALA
jgi:hypothetical protein